MTGRTWRKASHQTLIVSFMYIHTPNPYPFLFIPSPPNGKMIKESMRKRRTKDKLKPKDQSQIDDGYISNGDSVTSRCPYCNPL